MNLTPEKALIFAAMAQDWADRPGYDFRPAEQEKLDRQNKLWQEMADYFKSIAAQAQVSK